MEKEWKPFRVTDYFTPVRGREGNMADLPSGHIPLISARNINNGLKGFVSNPNNIIAGNVITINNDGDGGAGLAYYQPFAMALDTHVTALVPIKELEGNSQIYTACCLSGLHDFFGHGRSMSNGRVSNIKVMLPADIHDSPDWEYMSSYVKNKKEEMISMYKKYLVQKLSSLEYKEILNLSQIQWKEFKIEDIFWIFPGKRLEKRNMISGERPFIGASDRNNGVTAFVSNVNESLDNCVLGVNYNGSVCEAFYHPYECIFSDDVKRFKLKNGLNNKAILLFMSVIIRNQKRIYEYAYKFKEKRMKRQIILLPATDDGQPDYAYMEQYAKNLMIKKYNQYLNYLNNIRENQA